LKPTRAHFIFFYTFFTLTILPIYPYLLWLKRENKTGRIGEIRKSWLRLGLFIVGYRYKIIDFASNSTLQSISLPSPVIVCANHRSALDVAILIACLPADYCFMAKAELLQTPIISIFLKTIDIPVYRADKQASMRASIAAIQVLKSGRGLVIFPEGGIADNAGILEPFTQGAALIAFKTNTPILPISLPDCNSLMPDAKNSSKAGDIRLILHQLLSPKSDLAQQNEQLYDSILAGLLKYGYR